METDDLKVQSCKCKTFLLLQLKQKFNISTAWSTNSPVKLGEKWPLPEKNSNKAEIFTRCLGRL